MSALTDKLAKLEAEATPGEWSYFHDTCDRCRAEGTAEFELIGPSYGYHATCDNEADAALLAAAKSLPELARALEECAGWLETRPDYTEGDAATAASARTALANLAKRLGVKEEGT